LSVLWAGLDGARIDLPDGSVDHVVISFTLCTVSDPAAVLREAARVIAPGGELRVLEHGVAPDAGIRRWQQRLNGVEQVLADGCQLVRDPAAIIEDSPWTVQSTYQAYAGRATPWSYFTSVRATIW
jgi:ubiquinone/menaquinone biosynthesis C-methylase UbiE